MHLRHLTAAALLGAAALPGAASAAPSITELPSRTTALTVARAADAVCTDRVRRGASIARLPYRAAKEGFVTFRLQGGRRSDWDAALLDARGGKLAASAGSTADEVVSAWVRAGQRVVLQACRREGARRIPVRVDAIVARKPADDGFAPRLVRVRHTGTGSIGILEELGLDVTEARTSKWVDVVLHAPAELALLRRTGLGFTTVIEDLNAQFAKDRRTDAVNAADEELGAVPSGRETYREYEDFGNELKALVEKYPTLARSVALPGTSFQGRVTEGIEIGRDVNAPEDGRPVYLTVGMHHAREWPSAEISMEWAYYLLQNYGKDERVTRIVDTTRLVIIPIINPDAFVATKSATFDPQTDPQYTAAAATGTGGYRRKTCSNDLGDPSIPCELSLGTDPNRNYGAGWGGVGASSSKESQTYRGNAAFSEPETQHLREFAQGRNITTMLTIHNVAALVLRSPGRSSDGLAPDEDRLKALGDAIADANGYVSQYGWQLYDTSGTTEDWFYAATGAFGYTIELGPFEGFFHMPYDVGVINEWNGLGAKPDGKEEQPGRGMREGLLLAAENAANPQDHGVLAGQAPAKSKLTLTKTFATDTSDVCAATLDFPVRFVAPPLSETTKSRCVGNLGVQKLPETLTYTMETKDADFEWHVPPSTRPFVGRAGTKEQYTLTCERPGKDPVVQQVTVDRGQRVGGLKPCQA
jgi:hypothetical protein